MADNPVAPTIDIADFAAVDIRLGEIVEAETFAKARKPAIRLLVDFGGSIGRRKSSAQIADHYEPENLIGRRVLAVVNLPPRQIGPMRSEVLVLGLPDEAGGILLIEPDRDLAASSLKLGARLA